MTRKISLDLDEKNDKKLQACVNRFELTQSDVIRLAIRDMFDKYTFGICKDCPNTATITTPKITINMEMSETQKVELVKIVENTVKEVLGN